METIIIIFSVLLNVFCLWMIWRLNIYIATLEQKIEANQELTEELLITIKTLAPEGMVNADGTMRKIRIQQS